ncbi:uncharacterized protein LOC134232727 [Saccostrea cucullata]|uniref:uncharacterized protein LOC134232727 n=1 Tax=Saccostrea cuccullata TaxID=36930 RepID=UPI002ED2D995
MGMCMMVCNRFELCRSVDWIREKKICQLNTRFAIKKVSSLMTGGRIIHVDRESFPKHLAADCPKHTCTEDAICLGGNCVPVLKEKMYKDCSDIVKRDPSKKGKDGVYVIYPDTRREVLCNMTTDGGGWTVIQKRQDDEVDFNRTWMEYKHGFGNASNNNWIGNDAIYALTKDKNQELRVDLQSYNGEQAYAVYSTFYIGDENNKYTLTVSGYNGTVGDSLSYNNGYRFTTKDQDNDGWSGGNCGVTYKGGWWYNNCHYANLNGQYGQSGASGWQYMIWYHWTGTEALKQTSMMVRNKIPNHEKKYTVDVTKKIYKDCSDILKRDPGKIEQDGVYVLYADIRKEVYCDMTTDGGGWTVIQKREDGEGDFYRTWKEYKEGFGNVSKNYWIGNDAIHTLTKDKTQQLRVDLKSHGGEQAYAVYTTFYIGDEANKYTLTVSGYSGTAGDSFARLNGMGFSTKDQDNDLSTKNCAVKHYGAWWYRACHNSNLNGEYAQSAVIGTRYPVWYYWKRKYKALKQTQMMIRHRN